MLTESTHHLNETSNDELITKKLHLLKQFKTLELKEQKLKQLLNQSNEYETIINPKTEIKLMATINATDALDNHQT